MALESFIARIKSVGLPTASHFYVEFIGLSYSENVSLLVDQASLPGLNIMTTEMRIFGEVTESPYGITYPPVNLSIILDNESLAKRFFDNWANEVFDRTTRTSGYYNKFAKEVRITVVDKEDTPIYQVKLVEAYPKMIADIPLDFNNKDVIRLNVTLTYKYWEEVQINYEELETQKNKVLNPAKDKFQDRFSRSNLPSDTFGTPNGSLNTFDWGNPADVARTLSKFGPVTGSTISHSMGIVSRDLGLTTISNRVTIAAHINSLSNNFVALANGVGALGNNMVNTTAPVSSIRTACSNISSNLTSLDSSLVSIGLTTRYGNLSANFSNTSSQLTGVTTMGPVPRNIQTIGANMTSLGVQFQATANDLKRATGTTAAVSVAFAKMGNNFKNQGNNMYNGASTLQSYQDLNA